MNEASRSGAHRAGAKRASGKRQLGAKHVSGGHKKGKDEVGLPRRSARHFGVNVRVSDVCGLKKPLRAGRYLVDIEEGGGAMAVIDRVGPSETRFVRD